MESDALVRGHGRLGSGATLHAHYMDRSDSLRPMSVLKRAEVIGVERKRDRVRLACGLSAPGTIALKETGLCSDYEGIAACTGLVLGFARERLLSWTERT